MSRRTGGALFVSINLRGRRIFSRCQVTAALPPSEPFLTGVMSFGKYLLLSPEAVAQSRRDWILTTFPSGLYHCIPNPKRRFFPISYLFSGMK